MEGLSPGNLSVCLLTLLVVDLTNETPSLADDSSSDTFTSDSDGKDKEGFTVPIPDDDEIEEWSLRRRKKYSEKVIKGVRSIPDRSDDETIEFKDGRIFLIFLRILGEISQRDFDRIDDFVEMTDYKSECDKSPIPISGFFFLFCFSCFRNHDTQVGKSEDECCPSLGPHLSQLPSTGWLG